MNVFVTVGTTSFDKLISTVTSPSFLTALQSRGYTSLTAQIGRYHHPIPVSPDGFSVRCYAYSASIQDDIAAADLVISHAGAGTALEVLRLGKPLIVVINEDLMGNHQTELADELVRGGHVFSATPRTLEAVFSESDPVKLKPFQKADPTVFREFLECVATS
eukprot:sb/3472767/